MVINTLAFIYARTDSQRLPGKIFLEIGGYKVIDIVYARAKKMNVNQVVVLTTDRRVDDPLETYCLQKGYLCFRGNSTNLVSRTMQAINAYKPSIIVRINGDSPFIEPSLVNFSLDHMLGKAGIVSSMPEMVSNIVNRTFPYGIAVECFSAEAYARLSEEAAPEECEHVTRHMYRLGQRLSLHSITDSSGDNSDQRLTLDTNLDLQKLNFLSKKRHIITDPYWEILNIPPPEISCITCRDFYN